MKASVRALTATASSLLAASLATLAAASVVSNEGNSSYLRSKIFASGSSEKDKFTPRFDGLRFIETLVTAHRKTVDLFPPVMGDAVDAIGGIAWRCPWLGCPADYMMKKRFACAVLAVPHSYVFKPLCSELLML
ncbi:hypothetical protein MLD38_037502 [Melastoma candidum]|uniref:Uncharacterized protein n=1 Tax=Melastoma candidum TaxID=119954 RepID=A0ACB9LP34_9MYRT|nr:hypothetical protein MLD38_037502 [Melastoma candidum]